MINRIWLKQVKCMGKKLTILLDEKLDEKFREAVFKVKGMRKGNLQEAVHEALEMWIDEKAKHQKEKK